MLNFRKIDIEKDRELIIKFRVDEELKKATEANVNLKE